MPKNWTNLLALAALALVVLQANPALAAKRVALLVGNADYQRSELSLRNPTNDVSSLGVALQRLGFSVREVRNASRVNMEDALALFQADAEGAEMAIFYYAGHGVQLSGDNHLIGVEFGGADLDALQRTSLRMSRVRRALETARPEIGILILDACRDNPFSESGLVEQGLVRTRGGAGLLVAYATDPGNVAFDGAGANSVFTGALLEHIDTPALDVRLMFGRVRQQVVLETRGEQLPWVEEAVLGEHYLSTAAQSSPSDENSESDLALWRRAASRSDAAAYREYLAASPNGDFVDAAQSRIRLLEAPQSDTPAHDRTTSISLIAAANPQRVSSALIALGLLEAGDPRAPIPASDVAEAFNRFRDLNPDTIGNGIDELFEEATRVSMIVGAATLQQIRTDMVALRSIEGTRDIAEDALSKIEAIAETNTEAAPVLARAQKDMAAILGARSQVLGRLDQSRSYYDEVLARAVAFVPSNASTGILGAFGGSTTVSNSQQIFSDARLFLNHVARADDSKKGSYQWLTDLLPEG